MRAERYRTKPTEVWALRLSDGSINYIDEWDEVANFLGLSIQSGRGEHATMRRPALHEPGNVKVTIHQDRTEHPHSFEARGGDWIIKHADGTLTTRDGRSFTDAYERVPLGGV